MACARDGFSNAQIHSLETNDARIDAPIRQLMYSTSLFSPVPKRLVTITVTDADLAALAACGYRQASCEKLHFDQHAAPF